MHQSLFARLARTIGFCNVNPNQKENTTMRTNLTLVALVATALTALGCGVDPADEPLAAVTLNVTATAPDCKVEVAVKPAFCADGIKLQFVGYDEKSETVNPAQMSNELTLDFDDSGEALGSVTLPATGDYRLKLKGLPTDYFVKSGSGGFAIDETMHMARAANELTLVIDNDSSSNGGSGFGNVKLVAIDSEGAAVTGCGWNFNSDQLDSTCTVAPDGATCDAISIGNYTVDVSCNDGALTKVGYAFEVIEDTNTDYTVIVTAPGSTGSGLGDVCVRVVDENNDHVDESTCVFTVDGNVVTPADDPNNTCDGALLADLADGTATIEATCGDASGDLTTGVTEDTQSDVTITVEVPAPTDGALCVSVVDEGGQPPANACTIDFQQLAVDPTASANPPPNCAGAGQYYFPHLDAGHYDMVVTCGTLTGPGTADIVIGSTQSVGVTVFPPPDTSSMCVAKLGLSIDLDSATADMGQWIGYGTTDACVLMTPAQLSNVSVVDFVQYAGPGTCTSSADPNCPIVVNGLVVSMKNGFTGYATDEIRRFDVTVEDANLVQTHVYIVTKNGYVQ